MPIVNFSVGYFDGPQEGSSIQASQIFLQSRIAPASRVPGGGGSS